MIDELMSRAAQLRKDAARELVGLEKEWPHHAAQARRSYGAMIAEAKALEEQARKLADANSKEGQPLRAHKEQHDGR